jgi:hypothetical protein
MQAAEVAYLFMGLLLGMIVGFWLGHWAGVSSEKKKKEESMNAMLRSGKGPTRRIRQSSGDRDFGGRLGAYKSPSSKGR